jgi:ubiquinone/menaquinone biosynthesis C-methylase UbiE
MHMNKPSVDEQISGARAYEALHVPAVFRQWCPRVLDAAGVVPGDRVLDVACGTGVLAREAAVRVGPAGSVAGVDLAHGMLAVAKELAPDIVWQESAAESLPYPDRSFDAVVSQFGLMFFSDRSQALREMARVLKPDASMAMAVWDSLDRSEAYAEEVALLQRLAGKEAADALRAPFVLGDKAELIALFEASGVKSVRVETRTGTACFPNVRTMVEADLRGWLPVMGVVLQEEQIENILNEAEDVLAKYVTGDGKVVFNSPAHIISNNG